MPRGFIVILIVLFLILVGAVVLLSRSAGDVPLQTIEEPVQAPTANGTGNAA
ncbi:hypothetical protein SH584_04615 [Sphingomonas sp. LY29]|uniref:hypothetical protein n=1 Tax=Sphingomonas sp. LY29 TaxID=3095341 RepID=UPI002D79655D|nr:hypothetical protein [Sphingomonas sp. LY29]WRP26717.1 hypothetical protein SH584_04615 [Sphingomonas sp. LY29]